MIYASARNGQMLMIGLSELNLTRLREGKPIFKDVPGMPVLVIVYGKDEAEIARNLEEAGMPLPTENNKRGDSL